MFRLFSRLSTWLIVELIGTVILIILNLLIPILMVFARYRTMVNFYFASVALSSSMLNCLYMFYLVQRVQSKNLSEANCRAIYYLQTSCVVVLGYTVAAMHANLVLSLFSSDQKKDSNQSCSQCLSLCLRRFFRRLCFCLVLVIWSLSFTATIPLLYSLDSNEKNPKPVYCPGTTEISYLEEWFDRNRFIQTILFNFVPFSISIFLSFVALCKFFMTFFLYIFNRLKRSNKFSCKKKNSSNEQNSIHVNPFLHPSTEDLTTTSTDFTEPSPTIYSQTCAQFCSNSFLRFLLIVSSCLIACIYPIAMRFYLIYFSVFVPLIFTVINYSSSSTFSRKAFFLFNNETTDFLELKTSIESPPDNRYQLVETNFEISNQLEPSTTENTENRSSIFPTNHEIAQRSSSSRGEANSRPSLTSTNNEIYQRSGSSRGEANPRPSLTSTNNEIYQRSGPSRGEIEPWSSATTRRVVDLRCSVTTTNNEMERRSSSTRENFAPRPSITTLNNEKSQRSSSTRDNLGPRSSVTTNNNDDVSQRSISRRELFENSPTTNDAHRPMNLESNTGKYFSNHLYENTRNIFFRR